MHLQLQNACKTPKERRKTLKNGGVQLCLLDSVNVRVPVPQNAGAPQSQSHKSQTRFIRLLISRLKSRIRSIRKFFGVFLKGKVAFKLVKEEASNWTKI